MSRGPFNGPRDARSIEDIEEIGASSPLSQLGFIDAKVEETLHQLRISPTGKIYHALSYLAGRRGHRAGSYGLGFPIGQVCLLAR